MFISGQFSFQHTRAISNATMCYRRSLSDLTWEQTRPVKRTNAPRFNTLARSQIPRCATDDRCRVLTWEQTRPVARTNAPHFIKTKKSSDRLLELSPNNFCLFQQKYQCLLTFEATTMLHAIFPLRERFLA